MKWLHEVDFSTHTIWNIVDPNLIYIYIFEKRVGGGILHPPLFSSLSKKKDYRKKKISSTASLFGHSFQGWSFRVITNDVSEDKSGSRSLGKTASSDNSNIVFKIRK